MRTVYMALRIIGRPMWLAIPGMGAIVGAMLFFMLLTSPGSLVDVELGERGMETAGRVTQVRMVERNAYTIQYEFSGPGGRPFRGESRLPANMPASAVPSRGPSPVPEPPKPGDPIRVRYLPERPELSVAVGGEFVPPPDLGHALGALDTRRARRSALAAAAGIFSMGGALLAVLGVWFARVMRLLRDGQRVVGAFVAAARTPLAAFASVRLGRVIYEFIDQTGTVHRGAKDIRDWRQWRQAKTLRPGHPVPIVYDPKNPARNTIVPPAQRGALV